MVVTANLPTTAERSAEIDTEIVDLTRRREAYVEALEDALVSNGPDVARLRNEIQKIESTIEVARATQRGLARRLIAETHAGLIASIAEGEQLQTAAQLAYETALAQQRSAYIAFEAADATLYRAGIARDTEGSRIFTRRQALSRFELDHGADIARIPQGTPA